MFDFIIINPVYLHTKSFECIHFTDLKKTVYAQDEEYQRDQLIKMKEQIKQKSRAKRTLIELLMYCIYVFAVFSISYVNRDDRSYMLNEHIRKELIDSSKTQFGFSKVSSAETFFTWLKSTLFPKYFPTTNFDGATSLDARDRLFFGDLVNHRVGPARLRQVRMHPGPCYLAGIETSRPCVDRYDLESGDEQSYCLRWEPYDSFCNLSSRMYYTKTAWNYTKAKDIWGIPIKSEYNIYGGGGYILNFEVDLTNSQLLISELMQNMWIDRGTRAVFMEFSFYNPNTNLFVYVIFLLELTELGVVTWNDVRVFRPYQMHAGVGAYIIVCYFIYIVALIISTVKAAFQIKTTGLRYFTQFWTILDVFCILIGYTLIVMWSLRYVYANRAMSSYRENVKVFVNFQHIVIWDYVFSIFLGGLVFLCTLRLLRILGYSKRITQLASVLSLAAKEIFSFLVMFCLAFFAFASFGYLLFGKSIKDYRSLFSTLGSLSNSLIGRNSLDKMIQYVPAFAQIYYIVYVFFIIFILITIFMAILNQSISEVKAEVMRDNSYGIIDVITEVIQDVTGISFNKSDVSNKAPSGGKGNFGLY
ncbi:hypothetical protein KUTeg_003296 [Tegillarca granosa]|uniref:Uncharacterized protein n=1 Tax=Tegillarca granosa TaxID=220873 RepID=A0ABQ9FPN7_TEGGR|nr:hypothetical protein KUTeg_003296 [Tegillarca granosa]